MLSIKQTCVDFVLALLEDQGPVGVKVARMLVRVWYPCHDV